MVAAIGCENLEAVNLEGASLEYLDMSETGFTYLHHLECKHQQVSTWNDVASDRVKHFSAQRILALSANGNLSKLTSYQKTPNISASSLLNWIDGVTISESGGSCSILESIVLIFAELFRKANTQLLLSTQSLSTAKFFMVSYSLSHS